MIFIPKAIEARIVCALPNTEAQADYYDNVSSMPWVFSVTHCDLLQDVTEDVDNNVLTRHIYRDAVALGLYKPKQDRSASDSEDSEGDDSEGDDGPDDDDSGPDDDHSL